jgi:hypothetical protein
MAALFLMNKLNFPAGPPALFDAFSGETVSYLRWIVNVNYATGRNVLYACRYIIQLDVYRHLVGPKQHRFLSEIQLGSYALSST